jgi:predicted TIM-barrel fold metal-dependent hydrolase
MSSELSKPGQPADPIERSCCVDTHFHVFRVGESQPGARYVPSYDAPWSAWLAAAQPVGVTHGVLVQTSFMGTDNRLLLETLLQNPTTLRGIAVVPPTAQLADLAPLHLAGVRGIRINLAGQPYALRPWSNATALWDAVLQLGWHVQLHTDTGHLPKVLDALPKTLPLVLDHFARPETASAQDATVQAIALRKQAPTYIKLSAAYRLDADLRSDLNTTEIARLWLGELGPHALLWGSDWPCTNHESLADYPQLFAALGQWLGSDEALLQAVLSVNPMRLYWK